MIAFRGGELLKSGFRSGLGSGFRGLIDYLREGSAPKLPGAVDPLQGGSEASAETLDSPEEGRIAWSSTRNLPVDDIDSAPRWMRAWANQNPRVEKPVYHIGVSIAPDEKLGPEEWERIADRLLEGLGVEEHQAVIALHKDREHHHIHIVLNRVGPDGRAWKPRFDALKQQKALRELERELGLREVPTFRDRRRELERELGVPRQELAKPFAEKVREVALQDFRESWSFEELEERLARHGLRLEPARRGGGLNVTDGLERAGLSRVDRSLSGPRLSDRFGETFRVYRARVPEPRALERRFREEVKERSPEELSEAILDHLFERRATVTREDLKRAARGYPDSQHLTAIALRSERLVEVGADSRARFALASFQEIEERMLEASGELARSERHRLPGDGLAGVGGELSDEQLRAIRHATRNDLSLIVGRAGSGKTRLTRTLVELYEKAGYRVRGAALSGQAAKVLEAEARGRGAPAPARPPGPRSLEGPPECRGPRARAASRRGSEAPEAQEGHSACAPDRPGGSRGGVSHDPDGGAGRPPSPRAG